LLTLPLARRWASPSLAVPANASSERIAILCTLFAGISSDAAALTALQLAETLDSGVVVTIFPDSGYKYLSDKKLWSNE
jgi:cysteine synthase